MLKQQDMTEAARVVFNELSVTDPATVREIAQNTYLSRERCPVNTDPACYGGSGRLSVWLLQTPSVLKAFLFVVNGRLVGVVVVAFPLLKKENARLLAGYQLAGEIFKYFTIQAVDCCLVLRGVC